MVVIVKIAKDGQLVWDVIPVNARYTNNSRIGIFHHIKK